MQKKLLACALLAAVTLITGCNQSPKTETPAPAVAASTASSASASATSTLTSSNLPASAPTYRIVGDASGAPFTLNDDKGRAVGFDVDLMTAIGEKEGFKVDAFNRQWETVFDLLDNGGTDIVGSSVIITPERLEKMDFSDVYMDSYMAVAVKDPNITSTDMLKTKKIAVVAKSPREKYFKEHMPSATLVEFPSFYLAYQGMINGQADAVAEDYLTIKPLRDRLQNKNNVKLLVFPDAKYPYGFAIKKGRPDLVKKVNDGLAKVKADGTFDKLKQKWIGDTTEISGLASTASATASAPK